MTLLSMPSRHRSATRRAGLGTVCGALVLSLAVPARVSHAQVPPPQTPASGPKVINGYAEQLRAKVPRAAGAQNAAYAPIKPMADDGQVPEIEMFVGESRVFPTPGVGRIAVGNGAILTAAALDNKEVILFANGVGTSSLFVWNEDGRYQRLKVNIVPGDTSRYAREIAAFLTTIPKARASIIGDKVIVEGDELSDSDLNRIDLLAARYPQIVNFTNRLGFEQMVMMDVKVVEFPVTELRELGLKWNAVGGAAIGGIWSPGRRGHDGPYQINIRTGPENSPPIVNPLDPGAGVPLSRSLNVLSVVNMGLNATLHALAQEGKTTILAEPQLSARNGAKASFLAGGEIPYAVSNLFGTTVQFKPYGVKLDIQPRVDRNGAIRATIETEFSQIDGSVTTSGGPALLTRKTSTEFNVRSGETIVLSGLVQRENATNIDKVPFLGDVPVLGHLFKSRKFQNKETELVVFVTPTVVDSRSAGVVDRVQRTQERLEERLGPSPHLTNPLQPGANPGRLDRKHGAVPAAPQGAIAAAAPSPASPAPVVMAQPANAAPVESVQLAAAPLAARNATSFKHAPQAETATRGAPVNRPVSAAAPRDLTLGAGAASREYIVGLDRLALRVTPDINAPVLRNLPAGQHVSALFTEARGPWTAVEVQGQRGWVATKWLQPMVNETPSVPAQKE
jgi:pilus assembly protein CpaC